MTSFPVPAIYDRSHGPAIGAANDGIAPGATYEAVIAAVAVGDIIEVTIPGLDPQMRYKARCAAGCPAVRGEECLVVFDDSKVPWVVTGAASERAFRVLESGRTEQTSEKTKISAPSVTATSPILAIMELSEGFNACSVTNREPGVGFTVWSSYLAGRHINWAVL